MAIINTFLPIYKKTIYSTETKKCFFEKLESWSFQKVQKLSYKF